MPARTHGDSGTLVYEAWKSMHRRCRTAKGRIARLYREKGITVCRRWEDFSLFLEDMGDLPYPGATLERKSNSRGYSKSNCAWVPKGHQSRNTSRTVFVVYRGRRRKLFDLIQAAGLNYKVAYRRLYGSGWTLERTLNTPVGSRP